MFETTAKLIEVIQAPYKVNGNEGISYKLRFLVGDEIWAVRSSKEQTEDLKTHQGKSGTVKFNIKARKEDVSLQVASFAPVK